MHFFICVFCFAFELLLVDWQLNIVELSSSCVLSYFVNPSVDENIHASICISHSSCIQWLCVLRHGIVLLFSVHLSA